MDIVFLCPEQNVCVCVSADVLVPVLDSAVALLRDCLHTISSDEAAIALSNNDESWNSRNVVFLLQSLKERSCLTTLVWIVSIELGDLQFSDF
jgi:hypothetical protein